MHAWRTATSSTVMTDTAVPYEFLLLVNVHLLFAVSATSAQSDTGLQPLSKNPKLLVRRLLFFDWVFLLLNQFKDFKKTDGCLVSSCFVPV